MKSSLSVEMWRPPSQPEGIIIFLTTSGLHGSSPATRHDKNSGACDAVHSGSLRPAWPLAELTKHPQPCLLVRADLSGVVAGVFHSLPTLSDSCCAFCMILCWRYLPDITIGPPLLRGIVVDADGATSLQSRLSQGRSLGTARWWRLLSNNHQGYKSIACP